MQDGVISETELQNFQMSVFSTPLRPEDVSGILKAVGDQMPQVESSSKGTRQNAESLCVTVTLVNVETWLSCHAQVVIR